MGNTKTVDIKQKQIISHELERQYIVQQHPLYSKSDQLKLLFDRKSGKRYLLRLLTTHSPQQSKRWVKALSIRGGQNQPENIMKLSRYFHPGFDYTCGQMRIFYLIYGLNGVSLQNEIDKRSIDRSYFEQRQLIEGL